VSTVWVPGNFLSEKEYTVNIALLALAPEILQFDAPRIVSFHVIEGTTVGEARGDYHGDIRDVVRPVLKWRTHLSPNGTEELTEGIEP
jgi:hypothetical protein